MNRGATITPDRDDSRSGQDYDVLVVRVNSAFSSAANSPLLPTEETRSDMINADGDSIPSVPGQRRSERELFPAQDDESSLHCDSRAPTATSSPLQDSSSGSQYEHAGGSSMEDSNAYKDCDEASRLGEDCHSNDHHLEASIMEEIDLSSGYYTDNTMDERESSVSDKTATRESDGSPGDDSNDPSGEYKRGHLNDGRSCFQKSMSSALRKRKSRRSRWVCGVGSRENARQVHRCRSPMSPGC